MTGAVLVTGANGFVGRAVVESLTGDSVPVHAATRRMDAKVPTRARPVEVGDIDATTNWEQALSGVEAVVHCAARVHQLRDGAEDPLTAFREVNRDGTARLARQAAAQGIDRFVFISSIGVNGAETLDRPFRPDDAPAPHSPYAISKHEAEFALREISGETGLRVTVLRPPLVYGPDAPGNFATLLRAVHRGVPLPFGAIHNRRSFVALANLVDLIRCTLRHDAAPGKTFLVSDGEDLSTTDLLRRTALALGRPSRLLPVPGSWLRTAIGMLGRPELGQRLIGSLQVDISATREELGWHPPVRVDDALLTTAQHFLAARDR
jgi:nucleoside-diphosphate-sugar epimerase